MPSRGSHAWLSVGAVALGLSVATPAHAEPSLTARAERGHRRFGVTVDAGVPDGAQAALVFRPIRALRVHAGGGYNLVSKGVRGGLTLAPLSSWFSPTLSIDVGRYFEGDANPLAQRIKGDPTYSSPMLERVGYDYANAHLGLEFGRQWATFYVHAGVSRVSGTVYGVAEAIGEDVTIEGDPDVTLWSPSARIGLIVYVAK